MADEVAPTPAPKPIKILVVVEGGVVQTVLSNKPNVEVEVRDWDDLDKDNEDEVTKNDDKDYPYEAL